MLGTQNAVNGLYDSQREELGLKPRLDRMTDEQLKQRMNRLNEEARQKEEAAKQASNKNVDDVWNAYRRYQQLLLKMNNGENLSNADYSFMASFAKNYSTMNGLFTGKTNPEAGKFYSYS